MPYGQVSHVFQEIVSMNLPSRPLGVKAGALAACVGSVAFLVVGWIFEGVNDGDSTFNDFLELE